MKSHPSRSFAMLLITFAWYPRLASAANVSWLYGGFLKWRYLQIIYFDRIFHRNPSIIGITIYANLHVYFCIYVNINTHIHHIISCQRQWADLRPIHVICWSSNLSIPSFVLNIPRIMVHSLSQHIVYVWYQTSDVYTHQTKPLSDFGSTFAQLVSIM